MDSMVRKGISLALSVLMIVSAFAGLHPFETETAYADDTIMINNSSESTNQQLYTELATNENKPDGYKTIQESSNDPYGYGVDQPFYMNKQSELAIYASDKLNNFKTIDTYNINDGINQGYVLNGADKSTSYAINTTKKLNYIKMVAFDPTGSGRKDHIAVIGVYNEVSGANDKDKTLYLYVYDKQGKHVSGYKELGSMNWMGDQYSNDNDVAWYYNAMNFLDITAGDYDGDKLETLVVWGCFDLVVNSNYQATSSYGLKEIKVTDDGNSISCNIGDTKLDMLHDEYKSISGNKMASKKGWVDNRLCCSLETGDVNGDKVDDLIALSFVNILTESYDGRDQHTEMYRPYLAVSYGGKGASSPVGRNDKSIGVWDETSSNTYLTCMAADVAAGDIDGNGMDELIVAGMKNKVEGTPGAEVSDPYDDVDEDKTVVGIYGFNGNDISKLYLDEQDSNAWTSSGLYPRVNGSDEDYDQCFQQYCVKTVAINGKGNPEMIFMNGDLYSYDSSSLTLEHRPDYFDDGDAKFMNTGTKITNLFMISADTGNFDGNEQGYEQVVFSIGFKTSGAEQYHAALGMIGATHTDDSGIAKSYFSTAEAMYEDYSGNRKYVFPYVEDIESEGDHNLYKAHLDSNCGFNYFVCAVDNDEDGILVRYHAKGYAYTDPEVFGVLQAAPHFEELDAFGAGGSTTYSFSHTVSKESTETDSVSFGAGVTHGLKGTLGGYELKAGYAMDWSKEFTKSWETTKTYSYRADDEDAVILFRTPVTIYLYQVKTKDGEWKTEDQNNYIMVSVPEKPAYEMLTVDRYNQFAEYYNKTNKQKMKQMYPDDPDAEEKAPTLALLKDTDTEKYYLDTGGDPAKYMSSTRIPEGVKVLQDTRNTFSAGTGATMFSYSEEHGSSVSESMSHGFTFELTIEFDLGIECFVESSAGAYVTLEYMHGNSHTTTVANGTESGCEVNNAPRNAMLEAGFSEDACDSYRYQYQLAEWPSPIVKEAPIEDPVTHEVIKEAQVVPIIGYVVSGIRKPTYPSLTMPAELTLENGYGPSATGTFRASGDPFPTIEMTSADSHIKYNATTRKLEIAPGLKNGKYPVKLKVENGIPGKEATYTYNITVQSPDYSDAGLVKAVTNLIKGIPGKEELVLSDEIFVKQARDAYDGLSAELKAKISSDLKKKLEDAEEQIKGFKEAAKETKKLIDENVPGMISSMNSMISNISSYTRVQLSDLTSQFFDVRDSYNALTNEQKMLISEDSVELLSSGTSKLSEVWDKFDRANMIEGHYEAQEDADKKAAKVVKELIDAIGDISAIDLEADEGTFEGAYQGAVQAASKARKEFDALTIQQQGRVENAYVLFAAEVELGKLGSSRRDKEASQKDEAEYTDAVSKIKKIPATVKASNEKVVFAARAAYTLLSENAKAKVSSDLKKKLSSAVNTILGLKRTTSISKIKGAKKSLKITWKKQAAKVSGAAISGYQIQLATNKKFTKGKKVVKVKGYSKTSTTVKKLKAKKNYFVRIRTYGKVNGKTMYTKWSKVKKAKTK